MLHHYYIKRKRGEECKAKTKTDNGWVTCLLQGTGCKKKIRTAVSKQNKRIPRPSLFTHSVMQSYGKQLQMLQFKNPGLL